MRVGGTLIVRGMLNKANKDKEIRKDQPGSEDQQGEPDRGKQPSGSDSEDVLPTPCNVDQ